MQDFYCNRVFLNYGVATFTYVIDLSTSITAIEGDLKVLVSE